MNSVVLEQLHQLKEVTWDGNLISKDARDKLVERGFAGRMLGWNFITKEGIELLVMVECLKP